MANEFPFLTPSSPSTSFQGISLIPGASQGTGSRSTTTTKPNPSQQALIDYILSQVQGSQARVPGFTTAALQKITQQPSVTPEQFEGIAQPLRESLRPGELQETKDLTDLFRKAGAGSLQSGAFASSARRLVGDQASRRNQLLAANYIPLTQQLSNNVLNAIRLGLALPEAETSALRFPTTLASSLAPLSTKSESIGLAPSSGLGSGTPSYGGGQEPFGSSLVRLRAIGDALAPGGDPLAFLRFGQ